MNHKPGSVTLSCHLSWTGLTAVLFAAYPQHWTGRPAAAWLCSWWGLQVNTVASIKVGSYPTISPLPSHIIIWSGCMLSVALSVPAGLTARPGCYPASCPAEPGLSSQL